MYNVKYISVAAAIEANQLDFYECVKIGVEKWVDSASKDDLRSAFFDVESVNVDSREIAA